MNKVTKQLFNATKFTGRVAQEIVVGTAMGVVSAAFAYGISTSQRAKEFVAREAQRQDSPLKAGDAA